MYDVFTNSVPAARNPRVHVGIATGRASRQTGVELRWTYTSPAEVSRGTIGQRSGWSDVGRRGGGACRSANALPR